MGRKVDQSKLLEVPMKRTCFKCKEKYETRLEYLDEQSKYCNDCRLELFKEDSYCDQ